MAGVVVRQVGLPGAGARASANAPITAGPFRERSGGAGLLVEVLAVFVLFDRLAAPLGVPGRQDLRR